MAIYHCSIKIISRGKGKSAVAAAAYRSGEIIKNDYDGVTHDYTRKRGIVHTEILLPDHAPREFINRTVLWNAVERTEKNGNSQLAREIEVALPVELTREQNISLVREYVKKHFVDAGMCADICVHDTGSGNPHAHIMLTTRPIHENGSWGGRQKKEYILDAKGNKIYDPKKRQYKCRTVQSTDRNEQTKAEKWRRGWANAVNAALENESVSQRVNHRSYERQGVEQIPTVHMGVAATQMERKSIRTERGDQNREIAVTNRQLRQLRARINKLKNWLDEERQTVVPTLYDVVSGILDGRVDKSLDQKLADLKTAAKVLLFLQNNHIAELSQLQEKVSAMRGRFDDVSQILKATERRLTTLDEHIRKAETYQQHKAVFKHYQGLPPKKQDAFYEKHRTETMLYESAKRYLDEHLNGHSLPLNSWKAERTKLSVEKDSLYQEYYRLKEDTRDVERSGARRRDLW